MAGDWDMSLPASVVCLFVCFISQVSLVRLKTVCHLESVLVKMLCVCVPSGSLLPLSPSCVCLVVCSLDLCVEQRIHLTPCTHSALGGIRVCVWTIQPSHWQPETQAAPLPSHSASGSQQPTVLSPDSAQLARPDRSD